MNAFRIVTRRMSSKKQNGPYGRNVHIKCFGFPAGESKAISTVAAHIIARGGVHACIETPANKYGRCRGHPRPGCRPPPLQLSSGCPEGWRPLTKDMLLRDSRSDSEHRSSRSKRDRSENKGREKGEQNAREQRKDLSKCRGPRPQTGGPRARNRKVILKRQKNRPTSPDHQATYVRIGRRVYTGVYQSDLCK